MKKILFKVGFIVLMTALLAACNNDTTPDSKTPSSAHIHRWGAWSVTSLATCTTNGVETRVCSLNVAHKETRDIPLDPVAHIWGEWAAETEPTCTETGKGLRICTLNSSHTETGADIPALGHNYAWVTTTAPTCTEEGVETGTCTRDGATTAKDIPVNPDAHDWQQLSGTLATCTTEGNGQRKCKICAKEETLDIFPALGHNYAWVTTTAPTCTTVGAETGTCTRDATHKDTRPIAIDPNAHNWSNNWIITTPPTIVQGGIETDICAHDTSHTRTRSITAATFTGITDLGTYLSGLPGNTAAAAYTVKLNVNNLGGNVYTSGSLGYTLSSNNTKFVSLDLSGSTFTGIEDSAFLSCTNLTSVNIPNNISSIGDFAFNGCTSLASVTLPVNAGFTVIGASAFNRCTSLTSVNIPNSVTSIGNAAFQSCAGLTGITISNSITTIEGSVFNRCTGLTSVTIPNSVTSIGDWAFGNNTNLVSVTFQGTIAVSNFGSMGSFFGDLRDKFYAVNSTNGTPGTYTTTAPVSATSVWAKQ
jgi:hypothetical protein